jgi:hypothetical protein
MTLSAMLGVTVDNIVAVGLNVRFPLIEMIGSGVSVPWFVTPLVVWINPLPIRELVPQTTTAAALTVPPLVRKNSPIPTVPLAVPPT